MCSYRFGRLEAAGIVDGRGIGQPDDRADAGCGHQQPNAAILSRQGSQALLQLLPLLEQRAARSASAIVDSVAWPATRSRIRPAKVRGVVGPTFSPKPRSTPRKLISTSWVLVCSSFRAVNIARTSCAGSDLQCTGRNQPSRIS